MHRQKIAYCYGLATVLLWSTVASAFKISLRHLDHLQLLFLASLFSTATLLSLLAASGGLGTLQAFTWRQWMTSALYGAMNPFLYYVILFKAYALLPAQEAQPLNYTWAVTLALLSVPLLGQRLGLKDFAAILVSYAGVLVISTHGRLDGLAFSNPQGVALALGSTVIWALYWILNTRDTRPPVAGLAANFLFGTCYVTIATIAFSTPVVTDIRGIAAAAYVGVFEMGVTFVLWLKALKLSDSTAKIGNLIFISPFLSLVFIHFLVGEDILPSTISGLGFIMAGIALSQWTPKGTRKR
ncbi:drug/metabolite transporter (DMT)-like permease [Desulfobaculum xiamenense]|uniref:Drug/metabolite transporter (DMT)-like permease n=1 Tax=Desulfobaculum xiamenense TaxID=995050 RepID=A0A846QE31_9BACT|nr:DMT family transporter [Desulfobaculum xiamenense]NJB66628.1 drug/metabolite transporter (DMT)-like permease [Desulfobaculum xiamenense]